MDSSWIIWAVLGVVTLLSVLSFCRHPAIRLIVSSMLFHIYAEVAGIFYALHEKVFGTPANINVRPVPINASLVNAPRNGWSFADCPKTVWVRRKVNHTIDFEVGSFDEACMWYCWPGVSFYVGKRTGRIKRIIIKHRYVRNRGQWFRTSCGDTSWAKYFTSVIMAHIEVLKFSQRLRSHHPTLIGRVFKQYGENFFQEIA